MGNGSMSEDDGSGLSEIASDPGNFASGSRANSQVQEANAAVAQNGYTGSPDGGSGDLRERFPENYGGPAHNPSTPGGESEPGLFEQLLEFGADTARSMVGIVAPPGMGSLMEMQLDQTVDAAEEAKQVWDNAHYTGTLDRIYIAGGTALGTIFGVRQLSDAYEGDDAVDAHEQSTLENIFDAVTGGVSLVGTAFGIKGAIPKFRPNLFGPKSGTRFASTDPKLNVPSSKGPGLAGTNSAPWKSADGDIVIEELPGRGGVLANREPTPKELAEMAKNFEDIEFALLTREVDGVMQYRIVSGEAGEIGQVRIAEHGGVWNHVMHTHPPGGPSSRVPSPHDRAILQKYDQESSLIVLPDGTTIRFGQHPSLD
jgi:hypothetical protein